MTEKGISEMFENANQHALLCKRYGFYKNALSPTVLSLKKKKIILFVDLVMLKKMFAIFCFIDIFTSHKKSCKNFDLNICAQNRQSVSVLDHKQYSCFPTVLWDSLTQTVLNSSNFVTFYNYLLLSL